MGVENAHTPEMKLKFRARVKKKVNKIMMTCLIIIFIGCTSTFICFGGFDLTQIEFAFIKVMSQDLAIQGEVAYNKSLLWFNIQPWPATTNVSIFSMDISLYLIDIPGTTERFYCMLERLGSFTRPKGMESGSNHCYGCKYW